MSPRLTIIHPDASLNETTLAAVRSAHQQEREQKGKPKMKPDPTFDEASDNAYRVTADELRAFVERAERLAAEKKDIADQEREVMAEAKGRGYDTKAIRKLLAERKKDRDTVAEEQAVLDLYRSALGM